MEPRKFVLAGATGNLGGRIAAALLVRGASVRALVRRGGDPDSLRALQGRGAELAEVDFSRAAELREACTADAAMDPSTPRVCAR